MKHIFITILAVYLLLTGCASLKKVTETSKESQLQISHLDSSASVINSGSILESIFTKIDSSRITITDYSLPDSTGRQNIIRTTVVENNIKTTQKAVKKDSTKAIAMQMVKDSTNLKSVEKTKETFNKKIDSTGKFIWKLLAYAALAIAGTFAGKWIKGKITNI
jgi:flagellum-specific peptidoglycan hydrolase FlgJ